MHRKNFICRNVHAALFSLEKNSYTTNKNGVKLFSHEQHEKISTNQSCALKDLTGFPDFLGFLDWRLKGTLCRENGCRDSEKQGKICLFGLFCEGSCIFTYTTARTLLAIPKRVFRCSKDVL